MFRHRARRPPPFADFINWTDYRWDPNPWQRQAPPRPWGHHRPRPARRGYNVLQVLLAGLAVVAGVKLMSSLRKGGQRSWLEKGVIAIGILLVASFIQRYSRRTL